MENRKLIYNAIIFNRGKRFRGYLEIAEGKIANVAQGDVPAELKHLYPADSSFDIKGHWLLPGVIDTHVHFRDPGLTHKADMATESRAAVAGGVTSFIDMPNTKPQTVTLEALEAKYADAARKSVANYAFYIGATDANINELQHVDYAKVPGVKLFLGSSTGNMCVSDSEALDRIFSLPTLIAVHCEDESVIRRNTEGLLRACGREKVAVAWHPVVRSELACYLSTQSAVNRAVRLGTRLHVCHLSTDQELELFQEGAASGKKITCEACVAHLWFTDEDYDTRGVLIKCNPAVKSRRHREALRHAIVSGLVDVVSTDHAPHTLEEKQGDAFTAPSGMPMVQFSLRAMLELTLSEPDLTPEKVVELMCHNQARIFGIVDRGFVEKGMWADLVEVDPNGPLTPVAREEVVSKCGWSPMEGEILRHRIEHTWVNGALAYDRSADSPAEATSAMPLEFKR